MLFAVCNLLVYDLYMDMLRQHLITGERLKSVLVRVGKYGVACLRARQRAQVKVHGHALPGSRWRVVERVDAFDPDGIVAAGVVALADAERETSIVIFPVPRIA